MRSLFSNFGILFFAFLIVVVVTLRMNVIETFEDPKIDELKQKLIQVDPRAAKLSFTAAKESFTENKKDVFLCIKDQHGKYYEDNMLMYVALHELAHAFSESVDTHHTGDEFKNNFNLLLKKGEALGYFDPNKPLDYSYCPKVDM